MVWAGGVDADTRYRPFLTLPRVVLGQLAHDSLAGVRAGPCSVRAPPTRLESVSRRFATGKRILELNPKHPLVTGLQQAHQNRGDDSSLVETAELLYGTALLAEGGVPEDPAKFAGLLADRLARTV